MLLLTDKYFSEYQLQLNQDLSDALPIGETPIFAPDSFSFYTSVASVYSSKIDYIEIDSDSYLKHRFMGVKYKTQYTQKTDALFKAYQFARNNKLTVDNLFKAHAILSKDSLSNTQRGAIRTETMQIEDDDDKILYTHPHQQNVEYEFEALMEEISSLLLETLTANQCFYYAAFIHLLVLNIRPYYYGNGQSARLLEKWFLAQKLGERAWNVPSERHYYRNANAYLYNKNRLDIEFDKFNYDRCLPFLLMLPQSLIPN